MTIEKPVTLITGECDFFDKVYQEGNSAITVFSFQEFSIFSPDYNLFFNLNKELKFCLARPFSLKLNKIEKSKFSWYFPKGINITVNTKFLKNLIDLLVNGIHISSNNSVLLRLSGKHEEFTETINLFLMDKDAKNSLTCFYNFYKDYYYPYAVTNINYDADIDVTMKVNNK